MHPNTIYLSLLSCAACAGFLLSSCSSDVPAKADNSNGAAVTFDVPDQTRASITTSFDRFAVYGDMIRTGDNPSSLMPIFDKTEVTKKDNGWQYQGTRYWMPDYEHSFVAVYPLSVLDDAQYADSKLTFTYTLPDSNDDASDIIAATHRRLYQQNDPSNVTTFRFAHLLSLINFSVELTDPSTRSEESVKIRKLEMSGFGTSASISIKPASRLTSTLTDDSEISIVTPRDNGSLEISFDTPIEVTNGGAATKLFNGNNAIIMLPRTFAPNEEVELRLTYTANDDPEPIEVSATLSDFTWGSGRSYNYKIKLELSEAKEANMVISNATIKDWELVDDLDEVDAR